VTVDKIESRQVKRWASKISAGGSWICDTGFNWRKKIIIRNFSQSFLFLYLADRRRSNYIR
jgi:hypothetical protein